MYPRIRQLLNKQIPVFIKKSFSSPADRPNDNILHSVFRKITDNAADIEKLGPLFQKMGKKELSVLARQANDDGDIPYNIMAKRIADFHPMTGFMLLQILITIMRHQENIKKLNDPVPGSTDPLPTDTALQKNIKTGIIVANKVRTLITSSSTHPDFNSLTAEQQIAIHQKIKDFRDQAGKLQPINTETKLNEYTQSIVQAGMGNCQEFSFVARHELKQIRAELSAEVYRIANGNHSFLVIDRKPDSDRYNWKTWGEQSVVCDAWFGTVYPSTQISSELIDVHGYITGERIVNNFICTYNPNFHHLIPITEDKNNFFIESSKLKQTFFQAPQKNAAQNISERSLDSIDESLRRWTLK